ncbi:hypothetical protein MPER_05730, partial [Moniliophthora perniciosa FA553]
MMQTRGLIQNAMRSGDPVFGTSAVHYLDNLDGRYNQAPFWGEEALAANIKLCYLDRDRQVRPGFFSHISGGYLNRIPMFGWKQKGRELYLNVLKPSDAQRLLDKGLPFSQFEAFPNGNDTFTVPHEILIAMRLGASRKIVLRNLDPIRLGGLDTVRLRMKSLLPGDSVLVTFQNVLEALEIMLRLGDGVLRFNPKWAGSGCDYQYASKAYRRLGKRSGSSCSWHWDSNDEHMIIFDIGGTGHQSVKSTDSSPDPSVVQCQEVPN